MASVASEKTNSDAVQVCDPSSSSVKVLLASLGGSFTLVTLTLMVLGDGSVSTPPLAPPPLSCTWKVKEVLPVPSASTAGYTISLHDALPILACPAVTATGPAPVSRVSEPFAG